ncbi:MAG: PD-(D/E)XK nuclease family protein [Verrucomicrobiota bacterium]
MIALAELSTEQSQSTGETIGRLQETLSASRLNLFLQCRLKFYFRYVIGLKKPKTPALHLGGSIHAVLKSWNKGRWRGTPFSLKQLHDVYAVAWLEDRGDPVAWNGDKEEQKKTGWRLLETYFRESNILDDVKPDAVEVPVEADLSVHGLPTLTGVIDLVQCGRIIDFKTCSASPVPDKAAHTAEVQTSAYAVLYRDAAGKMEQGIELHHLVKLKNPKIVITSLPPMNDRQQIRLFHLMEAYIDGLDRRDFVPSPGMQCAACEFFNECRNWH